MSKASQFEIDKMVAANIADGLDMRLRRKHKTATPQAVTMALVLLIHRMDKATGSGDGRAYQDFAIALLGGVDTVNAPIVEEVGVEVLVLLRTALRHPDGLAYVRRVLTDLSPSSAPSPDSHSDAGVGDSTERSSRPA